MIEYSKKERYILKLKIEWMGLDLYHVVPTRKTEQTTDYFTLDELDDNPTFLQKFSLLIETVEDFDYTVEILVFPDLETKRIVLDATNDDPSKTILIGEMSLLTAEIKRLVQGRERAQAPLILNHLDQLLTQRHHREIRYSSIGFANQTPNVTHVLYWQQKGYQRKGMNPQFYDDFTNRKSYYDLKTVLKAAKYLQASLRNRQETLERSFKEAFIDNFREGESIFFASW